MGGATSIDITKAGVGKGYGLKRLRDESGVPLEQMMVSCSFRSNY